MSGALPPAFDGPVIETRRLTKRFGDTLAVDTIDFAVERGQVFGFLGPNGSGKTTTIGMLLGIITPTSGSFRLLGEEGRRALQSSRGRVGATLEQPNFYPYLSCRDNLRLVARVKGVEEGAVDDSLDVVGLGARQKTKFKACSLGMKQRLALAATMLGDPELVILDEPANGLDPEGMREIREIIGRQAERGATIFLSSHLLWEVERTCSHVAILRQGRIVRQGSVEDLVRGRIVASLRASGTDPGALREAVAGYPPASAVERRGDRVVATLEDENLAGLNRFLVDRGIVLSHLSRERRSLEDAFMEATGAGERGMGDVA